MSKKEKYRFQSLIHQVSVSFYLKRNTLYARRSRFQSLIHQVSVSFFFIENGLKLQQGLFQSLIHQVSVSFRYSAGVQGCLFRNVSIPYSSGQCFF